MKNVQNFKLTISARGIESDFPQQIITTAAMSAKFARNFYDDDIELYESFHAMFLNRQNQIIGYSKVGEGSLTGTMADIKRVIKTALDCNSCAIILVHNHPSGNLRSSGADDTLTKKLATACSYFDVQVLDHIILTKDSYSAYTDMASHFLSPSPVNTF